VNYAHVFVISLRVSYGEGRYSRNGVLIEILGIVYPYGIYLFVVLKGWNEGYGSRFFL